MKKKWERRIWTEEDKKDIRERLYCDTESGIVYSKKTGLPTGQRPHKFGYLQNTVKGKNYKAQHIVWFFHYGDQSDSLLDHINGNRADNRISNLRKATPRENCINTLLHRNGRLPGATAVKDKAIPWKADIEYNGKRIRLGYHKTESEAHAAYMAAYRFILHLDEHYDLCNPELQKKGQGDE